MDWKFPVAMGGWTPLSPTCNPLGIYRLSESGFFHMALFLCVALETTASTQASTLAMELPDRHDLAIVLVPSLSSWQKSIWKSQLHAWTYVQESIQRLCCSTAFRSCLHGKHRHFRSVSELRPALWPLGHGEHVLMQRGMWRNHQGPTLVILICLPASNLISRCISSEMPLAIRMGSDCRCCCPSGVVFPGREGSATKKNGEEGPKGHSAGRMWGLRWAQEPWFQHCSWLGGGGLKGQSSLQDAFLSHLCNLPK